MHTSTTKVFFRYARTDGAFVLKLASDLRAAGIDLWLDQLDIPVGTQWDRAVESALHACPSFLIVMTPASVASENVLDEAACAIEHHKRIVPVLLQPCAIPFRLSRLQYIDFSGNYDVAFSRVLAVLSGEAGARTTPVTHPQTAAPKSRISTDAVLLAAGILMAAAATLFILQKDTLSVPEEEQSGEAAVENAQGTAAVGDAVEAEPIADRGTPANGTGPAVSTEAQLLAANIVLAEGDQIQVREWLSEDPAYAALAQSCLEVLRGMRVRDPIPLDVVNARYRASMGVGSESYLQADQYGDLDKIRSAIHAAWYERFPNSFRTSFTDIVETR